MLSHEGFFTFYFLFFTFNFDFDLSLFLLTLSRLFLHLPNLPVKPDQIQEQPNQDRCHYCNDHIDTAVAAHCLPERRFTCCFLRLYGCTEKEHYKQ